MRVKEKNAKADLKLNMRKTKILASGPITSWEIEGGKSGNSDNFYLLGLQNHCGWWLQPWNQKMIASWQESDDKPIQWVEKQRLPTKVHVVKAMVFPVVVYGCKSWTIKKAEHQRIEAFKLWCWRGLLKVPWTAKRSNQSTVKGNQPWILVERTDAETSSSILVTWCEQLTH